MAADALQALDSAVRRLVSGKDVVVAFSGGVDSCLVASLAFGHASKVSLCVSGFEGSHDIASAGSAAEAMGWELDAVPMNDGSVLRLAGTMVRELGIDDPVTVSFELPLAHVMEACGGGYIRDTDSAAD